MKKLSLMAFISCAALAIVSCGPNKKQKNLKASAGETPTIIPPSAEERARVQQKWDLLAAELKIGNNQISISEEEKEDLRQKVLASKADSKNAAYKARFDALLKDKITAQLKTPSAWLGSEEEQFMAYTAKFSSEILPRMISTAFATRGAEIVDFRPASKITPAYRVKVFELDYRLQKNHAGEAEDGIRTALISFPEVVTAEPTPLPVLVFAHGDDLGLSYEGLSTQLGELQEKNIVIAPSFPGEPICAGDTGKRDERTGARSLSCALPSEMISPARGVSIPWSNDVDELLGLYDCFTKVALNHFQGNAVLTDPSLAVHFLRQQGDAAIRFKETIESFGGLKYARAFPYSGIVGVSRGGLVGSLALAKAGAAWRTISSSKDGMGPLILGGKEPNKIALQFWKNITNIALPLPPSLENSFFVNHAQIQGLLGTRYGYMPPATFNGLITLAAPASITIGSFRMVLEQMVKGNGKTAINPAIPCLAQLHHIFDEYRDYQGDDEDLNKKLLADAAYQVFSRDISFLAPLMMVSMKKWNAPINPSWPGRAPHYVVHHAADRIVPSEQSHIASSIMTKLNLSAPILDMTKSWHGIDINHRELNTPTGASASSHLDWKFKRTQPVVDKILHKWYHKLFLWPEPALKNK
jgi:hypothetical protein